MDRSRIRAQRISLAVIVGAMLYLQPWLRQQLDSTMAQEAQRDGSAVEGTRTMVAPAAEPMHCDTGLPVIASFHGTHGSARLLSGFVP